MNPVEMLRKACEDFEKRLSKLFRNMAKDYNLENRYSILCEVRLMLKSFKDTHSRLKENKDGLLSKLVEAFIAQHFLLLQQVVKTDDLECFIRDHFYNLDTAEPWGELLGFLTEEAYLVKRAMLPGTDLTIPRSIYYAVLLSSVHTHDPRKTGDFFLRILSRLQDETSESNTLKLFEHAMRLLTEE
jgi:hypothetical protein